MRQIKCIRRLFFFLKSFKTPMVRIPSLEPGYHDKDELLLHSSFDLLAAFVEEEGSHMLLLFCEDSKDYLTLIQQIIYRFFGYLPRKIKSELGVEFLVKNIQECYKDTSKEVAEYNLKEIEIHQEILSLYTWWTSVRPHRITSDQLYEDTFASVQIDGNEPLEEEEFKFLQNLTKLDEEYYNEDTEMLCRLAEIRSALWS